MSLKTKCKIFIKNKMVGSVVVYTFSAFLNSAVPFLILPLLTRYLSTDEYGIVSMFNATVGLITPFLSLGSSVAIQRKLVERDKAGNKEFIFNSFILVFSATFLMMLLFFMFKNNITHFTGIPRELLFYVVFMSLSTALVNCVCAVLQILEKPKEYAVYQNLCTILNLLLSLYLVVVLKLGVSGRIYGIVYSKLLFAFLGVLLIIKYVGIKPHIRISYLKDIFLHYGIPMIPTEVKSTVLTYTDRLFVTNMISLGETGVYSVGNQFAMPILLLAQAFNLAFLPWLYKKLEHDKDEEKIMIIRLTYAYFVVIIAIALVWTTISKPLISFIVGKEYHGAEIYVFWLSMGYAFTGMHMMVVNYIYYYKKATSYAFVTTAVIILNVVLNYILINVFGSVGAAQATMIADFLSFVFTWLLSMKISRMPWFNKNVFRKGEV